MSKVFTLDACPCCGGEARYQEYRVEDGYVGYMAGDVICMDCGLRTMSAPVDGTYGVAWTKEDFAERWNRRASRKVDVLDECGNGV